jgi:hypothetical protein
MSKYEIECGCGCGQTFTPPELVRLERLEELTTKLEEQRDVLIELATAAIAAEGIDSARMRRKALEELADYIAELKKDE